MHECEQITSCLKSFTGSHYSPAKTPHFYMSTWGPSCYGASLPPQPPWPVLHPAVISNHLLTQISYARSSITCFWASAVSSVWRTHCCFCFSQLILGNAPQLSLILGRLPRPCCVLMYFPLWYLSVFRWAGISPSGIYASRGRSLYLLRGASDVQAESWGSSIRQPRFDSWLHYS